VHPSDLALLNNMMRWRRAAKARKEGWEGLRRKTLPHRVPTTSAGWDHAVAPASEQEPLRFLASSRTHWSGVFRQFYLLNWGRTQSLTIGELLFTLLLSTRGELRDAIVWLTEIRAILILNLDRKVLFKIKY